MCCSQRQEGQEQDGSHAHGTQLHQDDNQHRDGRHRTRVRVQERRPGPDQRAHPGRPVHHDTEEEQGERTAVVQDRRDPVAHVAHRVLRPVRFLRRQQLPQVR